MHADLPSFRISSPVASVSVEVRLRRNFIRMREEGKGGEGVNMCKQYDYINHVFKVSVYSFLFLILFLKQ